MFLLKLSKFFKEYKNESNEWKYRHEKEIIKLTVEMKNIKEDVKYIKEYLINESSNNR